MGIANTMICTKGSKGNEGVGQCLVLVLLAWLGRSGRHDGAEMRKRRIYLVVMILLVVAMVALIVAEVFQAREPVVHGRPLSYWVLESVSNAPPYGPTGSVGNLSQMGTNAVPFLLKWISYDRPRWKRTIWGIVKRYYPSWQGSANQEPLANGAIQAFVQLGPDAAGAVPGLTKLLNDTNAPRCQWRALRALNTLGEIGLPGLLTVLTNQQALPQLRVNVSIELRKFEGDPRPAVEALKQALNDSNELIRVYVEGAIRFLQARRPKPK